MRLKLGNREIECEVVYKKTRHAYLRLDKSLKLEVTLPKNGSISLETLIREKQRWLERKIRESEKSQKLIGENSVYYKGTKYPVRVVQDKETRINLSGDVLEIQRFGKRKPEKILMEFLEDETLEYVLKKSEELSKKLGLSPEAVSIKKMKKFGYCTKEGKVFFNHKLICMPTKLIDFVVCHELTHLKHFNHSMEFKNELENIFPDRKRLDKELKKYIL